MRMLFVAIPTFVLGLVIELVFSALFFMANSAFIHSQWWDVIPELSFKEAFLIGLLYKFVMYTVGLVGIPNWTTFFYAAVMGLVVSPFLLPYIVGLLNDSLITSMPDITYMTTLLWALIGVGFGAVLTLISDVASFIGENLAAE